MQPIVDELGRIIDEMVTRPGFAHPQPFKRGAIRFAFLSMLHKDVTVHPLGQRQAEAHFMAQERMSWLWQLPIRPHSQPSLTRVHEVVLQCFDFGRMLQPE
jgi:hypothetical protein